MKGLTEKQQDVLDFLKLCKKTQIPPSTRDIQAKFGFASQNSAMGHLKALEKKGYIQRFSKKARAIKILK
jgi:repressor LexA